MLTLCLVALLLSACSPFRGSTELVVEAIVVDNDTSVKASRFQLEVSPGQGWAAALIKPTRVLEGSAPGDLIWINNMARRDNSMDWHAPVEVANGQERTFYLSLDEKLSHWCRTKVYRVIRVAEKE